MLVSVIMFLFYFIILYFGYSFADKSKKSTYLTTLQDYSPLSSYVIDFIINIQSNSYKSKYLRFVQQPLEFFFPIISGLDSIAISNDENKEIDLKIISLILADSRLTETPLLQKVEVYGKKIGRIGYSISPKTFICGYDFIRKF